MCVCDYIYVCCKIEQNPISVIRSQWIIAKTGTFKNDSIKILFRDIEKKELRGCKWWLLGNRAEGQG